MKIYILKLLLFLALIIPAQARENCFPEKKQSLLSPIHNYAVIWKTQKNFNEPHRLLYQKHRGSKPTEILQFYRYACVYWSPQEDYFALTDYIGSNITETYIYKTADVSHLFNVQDILPKDVLAYFEGVLHGYVEARDWKQSGLWIKFWGDAESKTQAFHHFEVMVKCASKQGKWICKK